MSSIKYSQEEIEQKRLLALRRKSQTQKDVQASSGSPNVSIFNGQSSSPMDRLKGKVNNSITQRIQSPNDQRSFSKKIYGYSKNNERVVRPQIQSNRYDPIKSQSFYGKDQVIKGNCYMISNTRFAIETSSFHQPLIETLKTIPSRVYDLTNKNWNFHINDYDNLMEKLINFKSNVCITGLPKQVLQKFRGNKDTKNEINSIDLSSIDEQLLKILMPFQREGICFGISKKGRCMIADDMGLGKTIQALGIAHYYKNDWPLLIVSPSSLRYQWSEAIYNLLPSVSTYYVQHFSSAKDYISDAKIVIVSYDMLARCTDTFEKCTFGSIILDESHALKNMKAARTKAVQTIAAHACHVILLSGTPALSRPIELYSQIKLISPNFMGFHEYGIRYCAGEKKTFGWDFSGSSNMQELQLLLKACCLIRRLKSDVLKQLPSKIRQVIILDPVLIKAGTKEMLKLSQNLESKNLNGFERHSELLKYYHESSTARLKAVCNYVTDLLENNKKFLIFAHHQHVMDAICDVVESKKIRYIRIDGRTSSEQRKNQVDLFQESDDYLVAVLSITTANAGITLTAAQLVVFAELFWNPGILCQAEDRVHRIGQEDSVVIQYLVAKQTADDHLWSLIQQKMGVLNEAGLNQNFSFKDADTTMQKLVENDQLKMSDFVTKSKVHSNLDNYVLRMSGAHVEDTEATVKNESQVSTEEFNHLLELDDEDFNCIDLDSIT